MTASIFDAPAFSAELFFPRPDASRPPAGAEDHWLLMDDGARIHARIHGLDRATAALVHFHGNGEVVADADPLAPAFVRAGVALALVEYRGYGQSSPAAPSLRRCLADAAACLDQLRPILSREGTPLPLVVMGRSLGGFLVSLLAGRLPRSVAGWILESAAIDLRGLVQRRSFDPDLITEQDRVDFDPTRALRWSRAPLLILHGDEDRLVPPENAEQALQAAGSADKRRVWLAGRGHNDTLLSPRLLPEILAFVEGCAARADRRAGSLVVQGLGDALGFLVEGEHPALCSWFVQETFSREDPPTRTRGPFVFGQYSDDTQLARELARSLVGCASWSPEDMAARVAAIFREDRIVGRGRATENAAHRLIAGIPWDQAGEPPPRAGNGGAMRAGPVGLAERSPALRLRIAEEQARITHQDPRARAAAILVAEAVAGALDDEDLTDPARQERLASAVAPLDPVLAAALRRLPRWLAMEEAKAMEEIAGVGLEDPSQLAGSRWHGISPMATCSALAALVAYARAPLDPERVLSAAIAAGGDVDTVAAMAGAMAGARVGLERLSPRLRRWALRLNDQGSDGVGELAALGHGMTC
jgi:ADP-ribosylglycohydrolase/alpha-beta hydrolase superfamily lysophospholipase